MKKSAFVGLLLLVFLASGVMFVPMVAGEQEVIKLGVIGPLTGQFAAVGQSQLTGAEMRAKEINAANGKYRVELLFEDDTGKCDQSVNATVKLITQNNVVAILGAVNSPCTLAMVPLTQRYRTPQFSFSVGTAITKQGSQWIFRVAVGAPGQTKALAEFAVKKLGHQKLAVLYSDDEYGASMANGFKEALASMELQLVAMETFPRADQDFTGQLTIVKNSGATALYCSGSYAASALIAKQAKQLGLNLQLLGDTGNASPKYIELGGEAVEGALLVEPFTPADPAPNNQEFVKKYQEQYGRDPDGWVAEMYDTVGMIHEAITKAGKISREVVRDYAAGLKSGAGYKGILGEWYFDKSGDAFFDLYKVQVKNGKKVILER